MRPHRRGLSLTEVLVAMFVMALGLMALLTLFPLGAMQVGQALKDDRTAQTVAQADAWMRVWWKDAAAPYATNPDALPGETALAALDDPNVIGSGLWTFDTGTGRKNAYFRVPAAPPNSTTLNTLPVPTPGMFPTLGNANGNSFLTPSSSLQSSVTVLTSMSQQAFTYPNNDRFVSISSRAGIGGPSYPVLIDPLGFLATRSGTGALDTPWVGRNAGNVYGQPTNTSPLLLPRRNTNATATATQAYTTCALTDDLTYQANGAAGQTVTDPSTGVSTNNPLSRQGRYHWAAMIQRPLASVPDQAALTVLVFDGRPAFLGIQGDEVVLTANYVNTGADATSQSGFNPSNPALVSATDRSLTLNVPVRGADQPPLVRRGGWVALVSLSGGVRTVGFHRITGLTTGDDAVIGQSPGASPTVSVTPVALDIDPPVKTTLAAGQAQVYLLAGLSEVFDRPLLTR